MTRGASFENVIGVPADRRLSYAFGSASARRARENVNYDPPERDKKRFPSGSRPINVSTGSQHRGVRAQNAWRDHKPGRRHGDRPVLRNSSAISRGNVRSKFAERDARASPRKPLRSRPGTAGPVRNAVVFYAGANSVSHFLHARRTLFMLVYIKRAALSPPTTPVKARPTTYRGKYLQFPTSPGVRSQAFAYRPSISKKKKKNRPIGNSRRVCRHKPVFAEYFKSDKRRLARNVCINGCRYTDICVVCAS